MAARNNDALAGASANGGSVDENRLFTDNYSDFDSENNDSDQGQDPENVDSSDDSSENDTDDDDEGLADGFLDLHMNEALRAIIEDDDDDEIFDGFQPILVDVPVENWQQREDPFPYREYRQQAGPTIQNPPGDGKPVDYFSLFLEDEFLERVVQWTNDNANRKINEENHRTRWLDIQAVDELKAFIGILLFIELYWAGRVEELWNSDPNKFLLSFPGLTKIFTRTRFTQIKRYLHFSREGLARGNRNNPGYDKLYKIRPLLDHVRRKFREQYTCGRDYALDEGMVPFKGRLGIKQYHKDKPTKWGIKAWMLCESSSGYLWNFDIYLGKGVNVDPNASPQLTVRVVLDLCNPLYGSGAHIYFDRFYTSRKLLFYLQNQKIYACGTVMTNRGFPRAIVPARKNELDRGTSLWRQDSATGVLAVTWQDQKPIHLLSTIHAAEGDEAVIRHNKRGEALHIPAPPAVLDYNQKMGGVDLNDRMTSLDRSRKTYKWYMRLARKAILWVCYNAYVIEGYFIPHRPGGRRARDFRSFIVELVHQLCGTFEMDRRPCGRRRIRGDVPRLVPDDFRHFPVTGEGRDHTCVVCYTKYSKFVAANPNVPYADVPVKKVKTSFMCSACQAYLCVKRNSTCFVDYHTKVEFWR